MNSTIDLIPFQPYLDTNREIDGHSLRILSRQFPLDGEELIDTFFASVTTLNPLDELKVVEEAGTSPSILVPEGEFGGYSPIQNLKKRKIDGSDYVDALDINKFVNELTPLRSVSDQLPYFNQYQITPNQLDEFNFDRQLSNPRLGDFQPQSYDYEISVFAEQRIEQGNRTRINSCDSNITNSNSESDKIPRSQHVKSEYDQYTPRWVRYSGSKKEGLCEICVPGKWLQLKNSAYW